MIGEVGSFMARLLLMLILISAILLAGGVTDHPDRLTAAPGEGRTMSAKTIADVLKEHSDALLAIPGVVGVAEGQRGGKPCIRVFVTDQTPQLQQQIPRVLHGYPVVVETTGEFRALPKAP